MCSNKVKSKSHRYIKLWKWRHWFYSVCKFPFSFSTKMLPFFCFCLSFFGSLIYMYALCPPRFLFFKLIDRMNLLFQLIFYFVFFSFIILMAKNCSDALFTKVVRSNQAMPLDSNFTYFWCNQCDAENFKGQIWLLLLIILLK